MSVTITDAPDYTGNVYIVGQLQDLTITGSVTVTSGDVNIVGPLTDTGYVAISIRESVQLDVNVTNTTLTITGDVTVSSGSVDISGPLTTEGNVAVAIQQSIELDVNVTNSVINIQGSVDANITNATLTIEGNVNVTNSILNVNITNEVLQSKLAKSALAFNGENAYVEIPHNDVFNVTTFTIIVWAKHTEPTGGSYWRWIHRDISTSTWVIDPWGLGLLDQHPLLMIGDGSSYNGVSGTTSIVDGKWHMVAGVVDGSNLKIYVDGSLNNSKAQTITPYAVTANVGIMKAYNRYGKGAIARILMYNRPLSDTEIAYIYNNPETPPTDGLILWLNFDEGSGDIAYDKSGYGNHGTIHNAVWVSEQGQVAPLLNINITNSQVTLDVNITNSVLTIQGDVNITNAELNIKITSQDIDLTIINPSGIPIYTGESGITGSVSDAFSPPAGGEYTVVSLTGRGRIHAIGWVNWGSATYDSLRLRIYKKNEDGSFTKVVDLRAKDFDILNGFHISSEFAFAGASSGYRRASALSKAGGMTFFDNEGSYEGPYGCVLTIPFDFKYGAEVRIYNPLSYEPAQSVVVLYGAYET